MRSFTVLVPLAKGGLCVNRGNLWAKRDLPHTFHVSALVWIVRVVWPVPTIAVVFSDPLRCLHAHWTSLFFAEKSPDQKNASRRSVSHSWATVKRLVFGAVGDLLIVIGLSTIVRSVIQLIQRAVQHSVLILASGPLRRRWGDVSVVAFHRRSPLPTPRHRS